MYGTLQKDHTLSKIAIYKFDSHNEIKDFIHGYRMVPIDY